VTKTRVAVRGQARSEVTTSEIMDYLGLDRKVVLRYLPTSAGQRTEAAFAETFEDFAHRDVLLAGDMFYFNRGKALQMYSGKLGGKRRKHFPVVVQTG